MKKTGYVRWVKRQGLPIDAGHGMADLRNLGSALRSHRRQRRIYSVARHAGITGGYVDEIPRGGALKAERHLYEAVICILNGQGATEIWDDHGHKKMFEWNKWSLFAPPLNTAHRLVNAEECERLSAGILALSDYELSVDN